MQRFLLFFQEKLDDANIWIFLDRGERYAFGMICADQCHISLGKPKNLILKFSGLN